MQQGTTAVEALCTIRDDPYQDDQKLVEAIEESQLLQQSQDNNNSTMSSGVNVVLDEEEQQPEEQQETTEMGTPKNQATLFPVRLFYVAHSMSSWSDRMWYLAMPMVFSSMFPNTLLPVALFQLITQLLCAFFGTYIGFLVDRKPRRFVMIFSITVQNLSVCLCSVCLVVLLYLVGEHKRDITKEVMFDWPFKSPIQVALFFGSVLFGTISELASMISSVSFQKDWAIVIAQSYNYPLGDMNAMLRRIDLFCNILGPIAFSLIITVTKILPAIIIVCSWNFFSMFPELLCMIIVYRRTPDLHAPKAVENSATRPKNVFQMFFHGWRSYVQQGVFLCSLAFVFLFMTVLHSGPLLLSFLASLGLNRTIIAVFYASCAVGGVVATFVTPYVITRFKVIRGGLYSVWFQLICLLIGTGLLGVYYFLGNSKDGRCELFCMICVVVFMISIVVSRFGLYAFDLAEIQLMQTCVSSQERGTVNATEKSLTKIAELAIYVLAILFSRPSQFFILAVISTACIGTAAIFYSYWCTTPYSSQALLLCEQENKQPEELEQTSEEPLEVNQKIDEINNETP